MSEEHKKLIEEKLQNVKDNVEPRLEHHVRSKGKLMTNIKTHFVNGKNIVQEAIKKSGASIEGIKNISHIDHKTIMLLIESTENINEINVVNRLLIRSIFEKNDIDEEMIKEQILRDKEMCRLLFENEN